MRIDLINDCVLVYGSIPMDKIKTISALAPKNSVMDIDVAQYLGCTMVIGPKDKTVQLRNLLPPSEELKNVTRQVLPDGAVNWLINGHRGLSSNAIFAKLTDNPQMLDSYNEYRHPRDPSDLNRCLKLLEAVPEFKARISEMAECSESWAALIDRWDELTELFNSEKDNSDGKAPETYRLMKEILPSFNRPKMCA